MVSAIEYVFSIDLSLLVRVMWFLDARLGEQMMLERSAREDIKLWATLRKPVESNAAQSRLTAATAECERIAGLIRELNRLQENGDGNGSLPPNAYTRITGIDWYA